MRPKLSTTLSSLQKQPWQATVFAPVFVEGIRAKVPVAVVDSAHVRFTQLLFTTYTSVLWVCITCSMNKSEDNSKFIDY